MCALILPYLDIYSKKVEELRIILPHTVIVVVFSEKERQTRCSCICKVSDGEKEHEMLPVAEEVQGSRYRYNLLHATG